MNTKQLLGALVLIGMLANANAASISLMYIGDDPTFSDGAISVVNGQVLTFDIVMDFSGPDERTLGGGFDIIFDSSVFAFIDYVQAGFGDPAFARPPDVLDGLLESAAFGDFAGLTGPAVVGTVSFILMNFSGFAQIQTGPTDGVGGPFISAVDFVTELDVNYTGATLRYIPAPAAVWFMLSGLGALIGFARK